MLYKKNNTFIMNPRLKQRVFNIISIMLERVFFSPERPCPQFFCIILPVMMSKHSEVYGEFALVLKLLMCFTVFFKVKVYLFFTSKYVS